MRRSSARASSDDEYFGESPSQSSPGESPSRSSGESPSRLGNPRHPGESPARSSGESPSRSSPGESPSQSSPRESPSRSSAPVRAMVDFLLQNFLIIMLLLPIHRRDHSIFYFYGRG